MVEIYAHMKPNEQILDIAYSRKEEIKEAIEQLRLEDKMWSKIIAKFKKDVCPDCLGSGHVMKLIPGCECDGPRMHTCESCKGTGNPKAATSEGEI